MKKRDERSLNLNYVERWRKQKRVSGMKKRSYWADAMAWLQQLAVNLKTTALYSIDMQRLMSSAESVRPEIALRGPKNLG